jgi:hypothetical protein
MTRRSPFFRIIAGGALVVAALATGGATGARAQSAVFDPEAALRVFHERVESYAALHRRLAPPPAAVTSTDPLSKLLTRHYLASAIRSERRHAQQGDVFTPAVATVLRWMLVDSIGERDGETFLAELSGGELVPPGMHPTVNEPYTMTPLYRIPSDVRLGLPPIPPEVDYRIAGHDLVLWDIYAGIVVDFVPNALTSRVTTEE